MNNHIQEHPLTLRRTFRLLSRLSIVVLALTACGGRHSQRIATLPPYLTTQQALNETNSFQTLPPPAITQETGIPTVLPNPGQSTTPSVELYNFPPTRFYFKQRPFRLALLAGVDDPFFATLAMGARQAAANLDVELFAQFPQNWDPSEQSLMLDGLLARGDLDGLLVTPDDPQALMPGLQKAVESGAFLITMQTSLAANTAAQPLVVIKTDESKGGYLACQALISQLNPLEETSVKTTPTPRKIYIQKGIPGLTNPEALEQGCKDGLAQYTDVQLVAVDSNGGDGKKASQLITALVAKEPDLSAIFCTDLLCAQAASQVLSIQGMRDKVKIVAMEATPVALDLLRRGLIDLLVTSKPYEMGYMAVALATATLDGVTSLPSELTTGWEIITSQNQAEPAISRWLYVDQGGNSPGAGPQRSTTGMKIAFIAGIDDPFYYTMARGAQLAATSLKATFLAQYPNDWDAPQQAQIIENLHVGGKFNALLLVPSNPQYLLPGLQPIADAGIPILTLDTSLDPSFTPLSSISSDNLAGGYFACRSLAQAIGGQGKIYIQNVTTGIPTTDARERGCQKALAEFNNISLVAVNYNEDDPAKSQSQLSTILQNYPDLSAIFCTNVLGAQAIGQYLAGQGLSGKVKVAAFDATSQTVDLLRNGTIDIVVAQKPADMGYLAVLFAAARLDGISDLPTHLSTGFVLLSRDNMDDPDYARFFYTK